MKKIVKDNLLFSSNFLEFTFEDSELNVSFNGIPACMSIGNLILTVDEPGFFLSVKEYLNHSEFSFLKPKEIPNTLSFGNLIFELSKAGKVVFIFLKEDLDERSYKDKKVYLPSSSDLILWTIVNAKEDFSIEKIREEILLENSTRKQN